MKINIKIVPTEASKQMIQDLKNNDWTKDEILRNTKVNCRVI